MQKNNVWEKLRDPVNRPTPINGLAGHGINKSKPKKSGKGNRAVPLRSKKVKIKELQIRISTLEFLLRKKSSPDEKKSLWEKLKEERVHLKNLQEKRKTTNKPKEKGGQLVGYKYLPKNLKEKLSKQRTGVKP